jgi:hypothetical protein
MALAGGLESPIGDELVADSPGPQALPVKIHVVHGIGRAVLI